MPPTPLDYVYCSEDDVQSLLSPDGETGRLDDQAVGSINPTQQGWLTKAINWATSRVNFYCASKYATADLSTSFVVNQWTLVLACDWLSKRRGNPSPFGDMVKEVMQNLKDIHSGELQFSDIGLRTPGWLSWTNIRYDGAYPLRRARAERVTGMSEMTPALSPNDDRRSRFIVEPN